MIVYLVKLVWWVLVTFAVPAEVVPALVIEPTEDSAAWDCSTMGNRICGPTSTDPATLDGLPIVTAADVARCAERLGGATDANLAICADLAGFPCGDPYTDHLRAQCEKTNR